MTGSPETEEHGAPVLSTDERVAIALREIRRLRSRRWTSPEVIGDDVTLSRAKVPGWFWNTIFTIITGGFWGFIWIARIMLAPKEYLTFTVDEQGQIIRKDS